jgi:PKD repeat protein
LTALNSDSIYTYVYCFYKASASPCTFCDSLSLTIHSLPVADFDIIGAACLNMIFTVDNKSSGINTYLWDFGDGSNSTLQSPTHIYSDTGRHILNLTVTNQYGCSAQASKTIDVTPNPPMASFALSGIFKKQQQR